MEVKFVLIIAMLASVRKALCIECYECDSVRDARCGLESFPDNYENVVMNCKDRTGSSWKPSTFCRTTIENVTNTFGETNVIIKRECGWNGYPYEEGNMEKLMFGNLTGTICTDRPGTFKSGKQVKSCICKTSLCNWEMASSWSQLDVSFKKSTHSQATATDTREAFRRRPLITRHTPMSEQMTYAAAGEVSICSRWVKIANVLLITSSMVASLL